MPRTISSIKVYDAGTYDTVGAEVEVDSSNVLTGLDRYPRIHYKLGEIVKLTMNLKAGAPWAIGDNLVFRLRLLLEYSDSSYQWFRINKITRSHGENSSTQVEAWGIETDLSGYFFRYQFQPSIRANYRLNLTNITLQEAVNVIAADEYGLPGFFTFATISDSTLANKKVSLNANSSTFQQLLQSLTDQTGSELEFVHSTSGCEINFVTYAGLSAAEKADSNTPDPTTRPIHSPSGGHSASEGNRIQLSEEDAQDDFFTRIIPLAGDPTAPLGIGGMKWEITSASHNTILSIDYWTVELDGDPVYQDDCFNSETVVLEDGSEHIISDSVAPNEVTFIGPSTLPVNVGQNIELLHLDQGSSFTSQSTELSYLKLAAEESSKGIVERTVFYEDVAPYANLFEDAGGSPDMSTGTGSGTSYLPSYISKVGSPTVEEVSDAIYVNHGTKAIKVSADADEGVTTGNIALVSTVADRYYSFWVGLRVEAGKVRVSMFDSLGVEHPVGVEKLEFGTDANLAIQSGGNIMADGDATLKVIALEAGTVFYLDGIAVTQSVGPYQLVQHMGPKALFALAATELLAKGGTQTASLRSTFYDVSQYEASGYEEVRLGSFCEIKDNFVPPSTYTLDVTARAAEVVEDTHPVTGALRKRVVFARRRPQFADRVISAGALPRTEVAPAQSEDSFQSAETITTGQSYFLGTYSAAEVLAGIDVPLRAASSDLQILSAYVLIATTIGNDGANFNTITLKNHTQGVDLGSFSTETNDLTALTKTALTLTSDAASVELDDVLYVELSGDGTAVAIEQLVIVLEVAGVVITQATPGPPLNFLYWAFNESASTPAPENGLIKSAIPNNGVSSVPWETNTDPWTSDGIITGDANPSDALSHTVVDEDSGFIFTFGYTGRIIKKHDLDGTLDTASSVAGWALAIDTDNKKLAVRTGATIQEYDYDFTLLGTLYTISGLAGALCYNQSRDKLYFVELNNPSTTDKIKVIDLSDNSVSDVATITSLTLASIDTAEIVIAESANKGFFLTTESPRRILSFDLPTAGSLTELVAAAGRGLALDLKNNKVIYSDTTGNFYRMNFDGTNKEQIFSFTSNLDVYSFDTGHR